MYIYMYIMYIILYIYIKITPARDTKQCGEKN